LRQTKPISAAEAAAIGDSRLRIGDSTAELAETPEPETANKANVVEPEREMTNKANVVEPEREMTNKANLVTTGAHHGDTEITENEVSVPLGMS
jgi:hypothetical protein